MDWTWRVKLDHRKTNEVTIQLCNPEARQGIVQKGEILFRNELSARVVADDCRNALCGIGVKPHLCRQHGNASRIVNPGRADDGVDGERASFALAAYLLCHRIRPQSKALGAPRP